MEPARRILLVGGGTGGHFYPLISLAQALREIRPEVDLYYIGPEPYDADALKANNVSFVTCPSGKVRRYASLANIFDFFKVIAGTFVALIKLYILYPDVVVSKGGYTSVPVVLAAAFLRIPLVVHESDTRPGRANLLANKFTQHVAISFEEARPLFKGEPVFTGIPMRRELVTNDPQSHEIIGIDPSYPTILVLGGSQGAERINLLILDALTKLLPEYNVIHQTGAQHFSITALTARELINDNALLERYRPMGFFSDPRALNAAYSAANLVISRAGTGTIYEIAAHGKPSILIPIPESISHDQRENAYAYAKSGAALVIEEANLGDNLLLEEINRIMRDASVYQGMSLQASTFAPKDGARLLAELTLRTADTHS